MVGPRTLKQFMYSIARNPVAQRQPALCMPLEILKILNFPSKCVDSEENARGPLLIKNQKHCFLWHLVKEVFSDTCLHKFFSLFLRNLLLTLDTRPRKFCILSDQGGILSNETSATTLDNLENLL